jgi:hypothetical protein
MWVCELKKETRNGNTWLLKKNNQGNGYSKGFKHYDRTFGEFFYSYGMQCGLSSSYLLLRGLWDQLPSFRDLEIPEILKKIQK